MRTVVTLLAEQHRLETRIAELLDQDPAERSGDELAEATRELRIVRSELDAHNIAFGGEPDPEPGAGDPNDERTFAGMLRGDIQTRTVTTANAGSAMPRSVEDRIFGAVAEASPLVGACGSIVVPQGAGLRALPLVTTDANVAKKAAGAAAAAGSLAFDNNGPSAPQRYVGSEDLDFGLLQISDAELTQLAVDRLSAQLAIQIEADVAAALSTAAIAARQKAVATSDVVTLSELSALVHKLPITARNRGPSWVIGDSLSAAIADKTVSDSDQRLATGLDWSSFLPASLANPNWPVITSDQISGDLGAAEKVGYLAPLMQAITVIRYGEPQLVIDPNSQAKNGVTRVTLNAFATVATTAAAWVVALVGKA